MLDPWYVTGFVDGEGCFSLFINTERRIRREGKVSIYKYWKAVFAIHLRFDDKDILDCIKEYFGAGTVNLVKKQDAVHFSVFARQELVEKIIPHFDKYPLQAKKGIDFQLWREAVIILNRAASRKTSAFSGQMLTSEEEQHLYFIRTKLADRLRGRNKEIFETSRIKLMTGKECEHENFGS